MVTTTLLPPLQIPRSVTNTSDDVNGQMKEDFMHSVEQQGYPNHAKATLILKVVEIRSVYGASSLFSFTSSQGA
jgi:hypothetical protein